MSRLYSYLLAALWIAAGSDWPATAQSRTADEIVVVGIAPDDAQSVRPKPSAKPESTLETIEQAFPSAFLSDSVSNRFQQDLLFRGFTASPVLGTPQGLAVYQNGSRINEPFGDTVLWDLTPSFAVERIDIIAGSDPVLGRNALGGAVALKMKTGASAPESAFELFGGSFGNASIVGETARTWDRLSAYAGLRLAREDGWRDRSTSGVAQAYGDLSYSGETGGWGASVTLADDSLNENGAVPVEDDRKAAFAVPDTANNRLLFLQARVQHDFGNDMLWRGAAFYRTTTVRTANGEASQFKPCTVDTKDLCGPDGDDLESNGRDVRASVIGDGLLSNIKTITDGGGFSGEIESSGRLMGLRHVARIGLSYEQAKAHFRSSSQLGRLEPIRGGINVIQIGMALDGEEWNKDLDVETRSFGAYVVDTISLTPALGVQLAGRWNRDRIDLTDRLGGDLSGKHAYSRFNPSAGLTWRFSGATIYASYGESSRDPTAAELSCSDDDEPCLFPLSFVSDPDLKQVVARTGEFRVDGRRAVFGGDLAWSASVYDTRTRNDILFISSGVFIGQGYFANVGATRRRGAEASAKLAWEKFDIGAQVSWIDASFRSAFRVQAADNPGADANGDIFVQSGDHIPNIPSQISKLSLGFAATPRLRLELSTSFVSGQYLRGDEANLQPKSKAYALANVGVEYQLSRAASAYLEVENLFDRRYATFGAYSDPSGGGALPQFSDPRFISPGQPRAFWVGFRIKG